MVIYGLWLVNAMSKNKIQIHSPIAEQPVISASLEAIAAAARRTAASWLASRLSSPTEFTNATEIQNIQNPLMASRPTKCVCVCAFNPEGLKIFQIKCHQHLHAPPYIDGQCEHAKIRLESSSSSPEAVAAFKKPRSNS